MNKTEIMNKATKAFYKVGFTLKKHSPEILVVAGVVGTVVSAVLACRATTKVSEIMTDTKIDVDAVTNVSKLSRKKTTPGKTERRI